MVCQTSFYGHPRLLCGAMPAAAPLAAGNHAVYQLKIKYKSKSAQPGLDISNSYCFFCPTSHALWVIETVAANTRERNSRENQIRPGPVPGPVLGAVLSHAWSREWDQKRSR